MNKKKEKTNKRREHETEKIKTNERIEGEVKDESKEFIGENRVDNSKVIGDGLCEDLNEEKKSKEENNKDDESENELRNAIKTNDLNFLEKYSIKAKNQEIKNLNEKEIIKLLTLMKKILKKNSEIKILNFIRMIIFNTQNLILIESYVETVNEICMVLKEKSWNYSKLRYLKGKVDYLCKLKDNN